MRERYESAVAKEKRLEAAAQPARKDSNKATVSKGKDTKNKRKRNDEENHDGEGDDDGETEEKFQLQKSKKIKKKKNNKVVVNNEDLNNLDALKEKDEVQDGIVWSEDDDESE